MLSPALLAPVAAFGAEVLTSRGDMSIDTTSANGRPGQRPGEVAGVGAPRRETFFVVSVEGLGGGLLV